jgi:hypothetical protein
MKHLLTLGFALFLAASASAQDAPYGKGTKLVGFGMNSSATSYEAGGVTQTSSNGTFSLQYGVFVMNGLVLGVDLNSTVATLETEGGGSTTTLESSEGALGLFAAYYIRLGEKHAVYPELRLYGGTAEMTGGMADEEWEISGGTLGLGYTYRMNPFVGFDVKLRAGSQTEKTVSTGDEIELGAAQLLLGFQIFL